MLGLVDQRAAAAGEREIGFPDPIAKYILYLKHLYPPIHYREIVRIIGKKFGYETDHHKVKRFLDKNPVTVQLELELTHFHDFEDAYEARWTVVRMFYEGTTRFSPPAIFSSCQPVVALRIWSCSRNSPSRRKWLIVLNFFLFSGLLGN